MSTGGELSCRELVELASDHVDGALGALERARVEGHLADCEDCAEYVAQIRRTIEVLRWALT